MELSNYKENEPSVVDEEMIHDAIFSQGPKGEEGRLFQQHEISYDKVESLRLDYRNILVINHLWMLTSLTKLQLNNNMIEKIENLEVLPTLKELDLSFNMISRIEKLEALINLEVLLLFENKIPRVTNLRHLKKLTVLSIGNNLLESFSNINYLRQIKSLKALNMEGNPLCKQDNYKNYIIAYIPQLIYYAYRMISHEERQDARQVFNQDLAKLENEEETATSAEIAVEEKKNQDAKYFEAFIEGLSNSEFFDSLFQEDIEGQAFLEIGEDILEAFRDFQKNVCEVTSELHTLGLEQHKIRLTEFQDYEKHALMAKKEILTESQKQIKNYLEKRKHVFAKVDSVLEAFNENPNRKEREILSQEIDTIRAEFNQMLLGLWNDLMKRELYLLESMEKVNGILERTLTAQISTFIEAAQGYFTQLRTLEGIYNEVVTEVADRYFTSISMFLAQEESDEIEASKTLLNIMSDKEIMNNSVAISHDHHLSVIDKREDQLVSRAKSWIESLIGDILKNETNRSRVQIIEINHFLDHQRKELENLIASPKDLQQLPLEIQKVLQLNFE